MTSTNKSQISIRILRLCKFLSKVHWELCQNVKPLSDQPKCWVGGQPYSRTKEHYNNNPRDLIEDKQIEKYSSKFIYLYFYYLIANILSKEKCCKLSYLLSTCTIISSMTNIIINRRFYLNFNILLLLILFYSYY